MEQNHFRSALETTRASEYSSTENGRPPRQSECDGAKKSPRYSSKIFGCWNFAAQSCQSHAGANRIPGSSEQMDSVMDRLHKSIFDLEVQLNSTQAEHHNLFFRRRQTQINESFSHTPSTSHRRSQRGATPRRHKRRETHASTSKYTFAESNFGREPTLVRRVCRLEFQSPSKGTPRLLSDGHHRIGFRATITSQTELLNWEKRSSGREKLKRWSLKHGVLQLQDVEREFSQ